LLPRTRYILVLNIGFDNKLIEEVEANKFLGLQTDKLKVEETH
jgi:hypothetical protein